MYDLMAQPKTLNWFRSPGLDTIAVETPLKHPVVGENLYPGSEPCRAAMDFCSLVSTGYTYRHFAGSAILR